MREIREARRRGKGKKAERKHVEGGSEVRSPWVTDSVVRRNKDEEVSTEN